MRRSWLARLRWTLLAACACALVSVSFGADRAQAGSCNPGSTNFNFTLGSPNLCNNITSLSGTATTGIYVELTGTDANTRPLLGYASGGSGVGVIGVSGSTNSVGGYSAGVAGGLNPEAPASDSAGVRGVSYSHTANGAGVWGQHPSSSGSAPGVFGQSLSTTANASGVYGEVNSNAAYAAGVSGDNLNPNCCGMGVAGFHEGRGIALYGESNNGFAVSGFSLNNWSGYFQGSVNVIGTLYKSSGAFRIDNPIDPARSYLQHSFVESPDMKNVYDGNVTTDSKGFAVVRLPSWFQALNRDFRYQLTVLNGTFAQAIVSKQIHDNRFTIRTNKPKIEVSWQVTGIRHDPYANAHRIQTVLPKQGKADGRYVHPELYGKPLSKSVVVLPGMTGTSRAKLEPRVAPTQK